MSSITILKLMAIAFHEMLDLKITAVADEIKETCLMNH